MGTKLNPGNFDCYSNALPDEPMFVFLARDVLAPTILEKWEDALLNEINQGRKPDSDIHKAEEAIECAQMMRMWRAANDGKWREYCANGLILTAPQVALPRRVMHRKRGTFYDILGMGLLQSQEWVDLTKPLQSVDMQPLVIYRGDGGDLWARPLEEFCDGRFIEVDDKEPGIHTMVVGDVTYATPYVTEHDGSTWVSLEHFIEVVKKLTDEMASM